MAAVAAKFNDQTLIPVVLEAVRLRLNDYLANISVSKDQWVILSNLFDQNGNVVPGTRDKVLMTLVNISHETVISTYTPRIASSQGGFVTKSPPLYINLYIIFYANMADGNYLQGLGAISSVISFFQQYPTFTPGNLPALDPRVEKLTFEYNNLDLLDLNHVMGLLGAKYLPSAFYKVRMLPFDGDAVSGDVPAVRGVEN